MILQILNGLCEQTGSFKTECHSLVDEYYLPLYDMLMSEVHPKEVCEAVGLCGLSSVFNDEVIFVYRYLTMLFFCISNSN